MAIKLAKAKIGSKGNFASIRRRIVGIDTQVPILGGSRVPYINFDNAASTPPLVEVLTAINDFAPWYASVHRGTGFKSLVSTKAYEDARKVVLGFFGGNKADHTVIFGKNSTEALNKLSYRIPLKKSDVVLVSLMEHHSNDLPWRSRATVKRIEVDEQGRLNEAHFNSQLRKYKKRIKVVAISGGSNVTGEIPDIHAIAKKAHAVGAQVVVDAAQLAPHRTINIKPLTDPSHLDYIAVSAHKMYAPYGSGAIIGRRDTFSEGQPEYSGGGTIDVVTTDRVHWADYPERDEAGSPNVVGAIAFATALRELSQIGMNKIAHHEAELTAYALAELIKIDKLEVYGATNPSLTASRLGVIPINIKGLNHSKLAAILGTEFGIGVRNGCFCAHPYVARLLKVSKTRMHELGDEVISGDKRHMPGLVRISFGMYNTTAEADRLILALKHIAAGKWRGQYIQDRKTGDFAALGWSSSIRIS